MRENIGLFKAKEFITNEWREGYYWTNELGNHFIRIVRDDFNNYVDPVDFEIIEETLCECSGLKDKNGKLIFENDIVNHCAEMGLKNAIVEFVDGKFTIEKYGYNLSASSNFTIIGNKFDMEVE